MQISPRLKMLFGLVALFTVAGAIGWLLFILLFGGRPLIDDDQQITEEQVDTEEGDGRLSLSQEAQQRESQEEQDGGTLPAAQVADGGTTFTQRLTSSSISAPTAVGDAVYFYDPRDGLFYTIDASGELIALTDQAFLSAETVQIAESGDTAVLEFPDGSNIIYDLNTGQQTTLPTHWEDFTMTTDGEQVASKSITGNPNTNALVISNSDGSQTRVVAALGNNAGNVDINPSPTKSVVAFSRTGSAQSGFGRNEIYLIDQSGEAIGNLIVEGGGFSALWSPTGANILYSVAIASEGDLPSLWYTNATGSIGSERQRLNISTWVEKCTFQNASTVICAVPRSLPAGSGLDERLVTSPDDLYQVDLSSGRVSFLAEPAIDTQMFNLRVSDDGRILYYTDARGRLNFIRLQ